MIVVTALALASTVLAITALIVRDQSAKAQLREHARERQLLTNQLLNLAGKPWLPAPAETVPEPEVDLGEPFLSATPDQLPDF